MSEGTAGLLHQKLAVGISTLVISLIFGLLPYHLSRTKDDNTPPDDNDPKICCSSNENCAATNNNNQQDPTMPPKWLSLATSFGGGVFLGAAMLHLLPEASEILDDNFPIANLLCSIGFLMVLALEEMMPNATTTESRSNQNSDNSSSSLALVAALSFHSLFDGLAIGSATSNGQLKAVSIAILAHKPISAFALGSILVCKRIVLSQPTKSIEVGENDLAVELNQCMPQDRLDNSNTEKRSFTRRLSSSRRSMAYYYFKYAHDECDDTSCSNKECVCSNLLQMDENGSTVPQPESIVNATPPNGSYGTYYQQAQIISSKQIKSQDTPTTIIICIVFFSTTSLLGTIIGAFGLQYINHHPYIGQEYNSSSSTPPLEEIVAATCQSVAAGSFLYAATMEALVKERGDHHRHHFHNHHDDDTDKEHGSHQSIVRTNRVVAATVGVVAMAFIRLLEGG
jgi:zinc transporter ZupT